MAERERELQFNNGNIPESQWTDEEKQKVAEQQEQAEQQPPVEDPNMVLARAEETTAQATVLEAQTNQQESQFNSQVKVEEIKLKNRELDIKEQSQQIELAKVQLSQQEFERAGNAKFNTEMISADQNQQKIDPYWGR